MVSKVRLLIAVGIWACLFFIIYYIFKSDLLKLKKIPYKTLFYGFSLSLMISLATISAIISLDKIPYNLLILPQHHLKIQVMCDGSTQSTAELKYSFNGFALISYSAYEKQGYWQRTEDSLKSSECNASLTYSGWLVENPYVVFKTSPNGAKVNVFWDGELVTADLNSSVESELKVSWDYGVDQFNKNSSLLINILSFSFVFPLILFNIIKVKLDFSLAQWFEDTSNNILRIITIPLIFSFLASLILFITPLLTIKRTPTNQIKEKPDSPSNIILIIVDALTAQDMSVYGYHLPTTPNLDRLTKDWSIYRNANTASTCSIGAFPSIITGRYLNFTMPFSQYGDQVASNPEWNNLNEILSSYGYDTRWWGYISPGYYHSGYGINESLFFPWNTALYRAWYQFLGVRNKTFPYVPLSIQVSGSLIYYSDFFDAPQLLGKMINGNEFKSPFFLYMHYGGVHGMPYSSGEFLGRFLPVDEGMVGYQNQNQLAGDYPKEKQPLVDKARLRYDEAILKQDQYLGELIEQIKSAGIYDSSMIIITGDHGQLFNNGFMTHCTPLISYAETHVPLLIKYPHQSTGISIDHLVSLVDLAPTILDVSKINFPENGFDGKSLLRIENENIHPYVFIRSNFLASNKNDYGFAIMNERYKLTKWKGTFLFYDYSIDPEEINNLLINNTYDFDVFNNLKANLEDYIQKVR